MPATLYVAESRPTYVAPVPHTAEQVSREAAWAIYGVFLLLTLWAMPGGVASLVTRLRPSWFTDSAKSRPS